SRRQVATPRPRRPAPAAREVAAVRFDVRVLGHFEVRVDGRPIPADRWPRRHSAALVKLLAMTPARSLHREQVIDALWPDVPVEAATPRLHKAAHYARKALGSRDALVLAADTVRLGPAHEVHVDALDFQRLAEAATVQGGAPAAKQPSPGTAASCCPSMSTSPGPSRPERSSAACTASSCARQATGTSSSPPTRPTSKPTWRWLAAMPRTVTAAPRFASWTSWREHCGASWGSD
ncbi:MAG: AfsR/SARP family transcriptional regulator, partial [Actinomycetes bacterium]